VFARRATTPIEPAGHHATPGARPAARRSTRGRKIGGYEATFPAPGPSKRSGGSRIGVDCSATDTLPRPVSGRAREVGNVGAVPLTRSFRQRRSTVGRLSAHFSDSFPRLIRSRTRWPPFLPIFS
jgi:hypothetical protein